MWLILVSISKLILAFIIGFILGWCSGWLCDKTYILIKSLRR